MYEIFLLFLLLNVKKDVLPGRYTTLWFQATQAGTYHLFCSQYCGLNHAEMTGSVIAMQPSDYEAWLSSGAFESPASVGQKLRVSSNFSLQAVQYFMREVVYNEEGGGHKCQIILRCLNPLSNRTNRTYTTY